MSTKKETRKRITLTLEGKKRKKTGRNVSKKDILEVKKIWWKSSTYKFNDLFYLPDSLISYKTPIMTHKKAWKALTTLSAWNTSKLGVV